MRQEIIVETRQEFVNLLRDIFIPSCNEKGLNWFVLSNQKDMFTKWTAFFTNDVEVRIKD